MFPQKEGEVVQISTEILILFRVPCDFSAVVVLHVVADNLI